MGWGMDMVNGFVEGAQDVGGAVVDGVQSAASATVDGFDSACDWVHDQLTPDIRPEGTNGHQIYVWFHHGPGTGSLDDAAQGWGKVSEKHTDVATEVNGAIGMMKANWGGEAARSAQGAAGPLRDAADTASQRSVEAGKALEAQSFGFNETKKKVTEVPADPPTVNPLTLPMNPGGYAVEATNYSANQQANQASLQGYGDTTGGNTGAVPAFDGHKEPLPPPEPPEERPVDGIDPGRIAGDSDSGSNTTYSDSSRDSGGDTSNTRGSDGSGQDGRSGSPGTNDDGSSGDGTNRGPSGTRSSWSQDGSALDTAAFGGASHGASGAGLTAGAVGGAGLVAGGGALLGGSLLGGKAGGAGMSGRGITGTGTGTGTGGRGGTGAMPPGGRSGVGGSGGTGGTTPTTSSTSSGAARTATGAPMAGAGRGQQRDENEESHERPEWLLDENDPNELFGTDERTAPPVIGITPAEQDRAEQEKHQ